MSLHYLLDGYNILKQIPLFNDLPLEDGRKRLLQWIEISRPQGSVNNPVTVVFDGHPDFSSVVPQGAVRVIFSDGCSADDQIKRMVEEDADCRNCVVVSDDKDIVLYARGLGARTMGVPAFTGRGTGSLTKSKSAGARSSGKSDEKYISLTRQDKINQELSRIWLKDQ